jgi:tetratricopeptide (TPR) repeat protein
MHVAQCLGTILHFHGTIGFSPLSLSDRSDSMSTSTMPRPQLLLLLCLVLSALTLGTFWSVRECDFINFDDPDYVSENADVLQGLTKESVVWAFKSKFASNWHPLTWLSHMLDVEMYGPEARGHHFTNLLLHTANVLLLFLALQQLTGAAWRSAAVAALFALHPLRVESVAWISERKDVLCVFFGLLTLLAYARFAAKRRISGASPKVEYTLALLFFALGLMAKPMLVTLPFVLLLLDFWPLRRTLTPSSQPAMTKGKAGPRTFSISTLVLEKFPFLALSFISCIVTVWAQKAGGSVRTLEEFPAALRLANAIISYVRYIRKMFWPDDLAVFYPHPNVWPGLAVAAAALFIGAITFLVIRFSRQKPFLTVGWFWFLGTMVPVIGIVQVGVQSMADRYTYLPMIGLYILLVWAAVDLCAPWRHHQLALKTLLVLALVGCSMQTRNYLAQWRNSETLYRHALSVTTNNYTAHENLGIVLAKTGRLEESQQHLQTALNLHPEYSEAHHNLGNTLNQLGKWDEAMQQYREAVRINPDYDAAYSNMGIISVKQKKYDEARDFYAKAASIKPNDPVIRHNLATALLELGDITAAVKIYKEATTLNPNFAPSHVQLGAIFASNGRRDEAIFHLREALRINPEHTEAQQQLATLTTSSN